MCKKLIYPIVCVAVFALFISANAAAQEPNEIQIKQVEAQVVIYTICRGPYDQIYPSIGKLYGEAGKNGIQPKGGPQYAYLNNPNLIAKEHLLTEVRVPVDAKALEKAGTFGEFTDVKQLPSMEYAAAIKPEGAADASKIYETLGKWIIDNGYVAMDTPVETFLANTNTGDYSQMKTEIAIPVKKIESK